MQACSKGDGIPKKRPFVKTERATGPDPRAVKAKAAGSVLRNSGWSSTGLGSDKAVFRESLGSV